MGNGPGDFEDYFKLFEASDIMCGGFVWEWCDHGIYKGMSKNGKAMYYYGGDHGETIHDSNFCIDGLVYPDRTPHTGLMEYKNVFRPVRLIAFHQETREAVFRNYMDFTNIEDNIDIKYEMNCDGVVLNTGKVKRLSIEPHKVGISKLSFLVPDSGRVYIKFYYYTKKKNGLIQGNYLLGFDEVRLKNEDPRNQIAVKWLYPEKRTDVTINIQDAGERIMLKGLDFLYEFNKHTGMFEQLRFAGRQYLDKPMELNIWRAPTDNDMYIKQEWVRAGYPKTHTRVYNTIVTRDKNGVQLRVSMSLLSEVVQRILQMETIWTIDNNGGIHLEIRAIKNTEFPELPRFGVRLFLNRKLNHVSYYGMGPNESYRDKCHSSSHGLYQNKVSELHEDYIRPQENGSHIGCEYVMLVNKFFGLMAVSKSAFSFNASLYTQEELEEKAHNYELEKSDSVILCLDYALNGIGSNSCGPELLDKYKFNESEFTFEIKLMPFENNDA